MMRLVFGSDHRLLLPATALFGASFLVVADTLARIILSPAELSVGVITALCGAPYFIFLMRRKIAMTLIAAEKIFFLLRRERRDSGRFLYDGGQRRLWR